jgi:beta-mannanase/outer membrane biosynthesis protein TonB
MGAPQLHLIEDRGGTRVVRPLDQASDPTTGGGRNVVGKRVVIGTTVTGVVLAAGVAVAGSADAAATAQTRAMAASDDAYVSSKRTTTNFGSADKLVVGTADGETRTAYVKFDVAALPAGSRITAATLSLPLDSKPIAARLTAYPVTGAWTEAKITGATQPALGAAAASVLAKTTDTALSIDLTAAVTKAGSYSFALKSAGTDVTRIGSSESGTGPRLTISYVAAATPAPTTKPATTKPTTPAPAPTSTKPTTPPATTRPTTAPPTTAPPTTAPATTKPTTAPATTKPTTPPTTAPATTKPTTPPTTAPATTKPTTAPTTAPTTVPTAAPVCTTGALLVPSCGVLWGAAAGGFTDAPRDTALKDWEQLTGRTATIFHAYHKGDEKFPTKAEIAMTQDAAHPRALLLNWKVAYGSTWAKVAAGDKDARIDAWAAYVKANYGTQKFFLALHHEPENDVDTAAGSGMTAKDFAAMYRHVVLRLRADGVTNVVNVLAYMGNEKWMATSWWKDLYPGDDVVDWVGLDSYVSVEPGYYHYGAFGDLLDRQPTGGGPGFYAWSVANHPTKPIMVAEWGMYHRVAYPTSKAAAYATVLPELAKHPKVKAIVYFDTASDDEGDRNIAVNSTADSLTAFRTVAANPLFNVKLGN